MILVRHPKQDECKVGNHLDLLGGFLNNHLVANGTTSSIFWIHSWTDYVQIMYVLHCFNHMFVTVFYLCSSLFIVQFPRDHVFGLGLALFVIKEEIN